MGAADDVANAVGGANDGGGGGAAAAAAAAIVAPLTPNVPASCAPSPLAALVLKTHSTHFLTEAGFFSCALDTLPLRNVPLANKDFILQTNRTLAPNLKLFWKGSLQPTCE